LYYKNKQPAGETEMTKNPKCESKTTDVECDTVAPELFMTTIRWAGQATPIIECLAHAVDSEQSGRQTTVIRH
jgi:hypothetical protein